MAFQIDHFEPQVRGGAHVHEYTNLMYSCATCNNGKRDKWPTNENIADGHRFVRPDEDAFEDHYELSGIRINTLTKAGEFTEVVLRLNRRQLQQIRKIREDLNWAKAQIAHGLQALVNVRLDTLRTVERRKVIRLRQELIEKAGELKATERLECAVLLANHSELLDADPDRMEQLRRRRAFLRQLGGAVGEPEEPSDAMPVG